MSRKPRVIKVLRAAGLVEVRAVGNQGGLSASGAALAAAGGGYWLIQDGVRHICN